jgi:microcystin-dependent protein
MKSTRFLLLLLALSWSAMAQLVPAAVNYQGRLSDINGQPITATRDLSFKIYSGPSVSTSIWGPQNFFGVPVINGYFNVVLGPNDLAQPSRSILAAFSKVSSYLEITVGSGASALTISPRQQVLTAPYAASAGNGNPPGTVLSWLGSLAAMPQGYLPCDGTVRNIADFPDLFNVLGTKFGGDGISTFSLPDFRGRFLRGVDQGSSRDPDAAARKSQTGQTVGDAVGSVEDDAVQAHKHADQGHAHSYPSNSGTQVSSGDRLVLFYSGSGSTGTGFADLAGPITLPGKQPLRSSDESRPKNSAVYFIVKY